MFVLLSVVFVSEMIKYGIWFRGICSYKLRNCWIAAMISGVVILLIGCGAMDEKTLLIVWTMLSIISYGIIMDCPFGEKLLHLFKALFIVVCMGEVAGGIIRLLTGKMVISTVEEKVIYLMNNLTVIVVLFIVYAVKRRIQTPHMMKKRVPPIIIYISIIIMGASLCLTISGVRYVSIYIPNIELRTFLTIVSIASFVSIICFGLIVAFIVSENRTIKEYLETDELLLKTQKNMYDNMLAKNEETRCFRHDIQNHLMCLRELADRGNVSMVRDYIGGMENQLQAIQNRMYTVGNDVIDSVLNYYISMLDEAVGVQVSGQCINTIHISAVELGTITSNLIQNAVEALNKSKKPERYLRVSICCGDGYVMFEVKNSLPETVDITLTQGKLPKSTKKNARKHGIGMRNVKETVEKNGGVFELICNKEEFAVKVIIPLTNY